MIQRHRERDSAESRAQVALRRKAYLRQVFLQWLFFSSKGARGIQGQTTKEIANAQLTQRAAGRDGQTLKEMAEERDELLRQQKDMAAELDARRRELLAMYGYVNQVGWGGDSVSIAWEPV